MKKTIERLINCIPSIMGIVFSIFGLWNDLWGDGNPNNAIVWAITLFIWVLIMKTDGDRERTKAITNRIDILARVLLPKFCKGNNAIEFYKKLMDFRGHNTWEDVINEMQEKEL